MQLKTLKTIDPYRTYIGNQDEAQKTFQEMFKKEPAFVSFIEVSTITGSPTNDTRTQSTRPQMFRTLG